MIEWILLGGGLYLMSARATPPAPREVPVPGGLTTRFDGIFRRHCPGIPVPFLRALAKNESDFNPLDTQGPAWGLMQVVESVRREHFERTGRAATRRELLDPEVNVEVACALLSKIAKNYHKNHPRTLAIDWGSRRWVELLVAGWNAGWSRGGGVQHVVAAMERNGYRSAEITIDTMQKAALDLPRAARFLKMPARLRWWRRVADAYMAQIGQA